MLSLFSLVALAQDLPTAQSAAEECSERADGWLSCETSSSDEVLDCACAISSTRDAYQVQVDAGTTASAFDGKLLVSRDLTKDQDYIRMSIWIDALATPEQISEIYADFVTALDSALSSGMSLGLAAETAAQRAMSGTHEIGHTLGIHHTGG